MTPDEGEQATILYRIEDQAGVGPWVSGLAQLHRDIAHAEVAKDDSLYEETRSHAFVFNQRATCWRRFITEDFIFGCVSLDHLRLWYPSPAGCHAMADAGARFATYSVPETNLIRGSWEAAFDRRSAVRLEEAPVDLLHPKHC